MKKLKYVFLTLAGCVLTVIYTNCGKASFEADGGLFGSTNGASGLSGIVGDGTNVISLDVGGCGGYVNEPCVSVTICSPGTSSCQTINHVLLDTGSYGLRLFSSVISVSLPNQTNSAGANYAECMSYMDGSAEWGPVKVADVQLGGLRAGGVPIQVIDSTFGTVPTSCGSPETTPDATGFNGILGVGLFKEDCGSSCTTSTSSQLYYACTGSTCTGATIPLAKQVINPVAGMPQDNNGVVLQLPALSSSGATEVQGSVIMGVGTRSNNTFSNLTVFPADSSGNFKTTFNSVTSANSFIDSGSNGLFFNGKTVLTACGSNLSGFFCPASITNLSATNAGATGNTTGVVNFQVLSANTIMDNSNPNWVFNNLGGQNDDGFDWGLPFFFGRTVVVQMQNRTSNLGTGPLWAY